MKSESSSKEKILKKTENKACKHCSLLPRLENQPPVVMANPSRGCLQLTSCWDTLVQLSTSQGPVPRGCHSHLRHNEYVNVMSVALFAQQMAVKCFEEGRPFSNAHKW